MLIRREAVEIVVKSLSSENIVVSANGFMSRDLYEAYDRPTNFYMIGSMGLASSIGLGLAIKIPKKRIILRTGLRQSRNKHYWRHLGQPLPSSKAYLMTVAGFDAHSCFAPPKTHGRE